MSRSRTENRMVEYVQARPRRNFARQMDDRGVRGYQGEDRQSKGAIGRAREPLGEQGTTDWPEGGGEEIETWK
jgi:hypothetical protein